jgi:transposase InsO family protein
VPPAYSEYSEVFSREAADQLPRHGPQDHAIELRGGEPTFGPLYNLSAVELQVLREYIDDNLQKGFIRPSTSPAGAPILFVRKKDGSLRLCVDYRSLNRLTIKNRYPLPLISEALDRLVGAKIYTKLDIRSAYNLIRIRKGDEWKTAFRTRYGHFEYLVMPFGLANAPATFQGFINHVLCDYLDVFCIVYLDDILIYSNSEEEHETHVRMVLERLLKNGLYGKLEKCHFHVTEVGFVGFVVTPQGTRMEEDRVASVRDWPEPRNHKEVQVFLGFANFYRRFIYKFSSFARPLTDLLKGGKAGKFSTKFAMTDEAREAFQALKDAFTSAPMLRHYNPEKPIRVETDASGFAIAGVLRQPDDDECQAHWHPVAFYSRKLTPIERNYGAGDLEMLAIVWAFKVWRHYLEGASQPITVISDHDNLKSFMTTKELTRRHARWWERLSAFHFEITYRPGRLNPADPPSRRPDYEGNDPNGSGQQDWTSLLKTTGSHADSASDQGNEATAPATGSDLVKARARDLTATRGLVAYGARDESAFGDPSRGLQEILLQLQEDDALATQVRAEAAKDPAAGKLQRGGYTVDPNGLVRRQGRIYVPEKGGGRLEILQRHHDDPLAGHFGHNRTLELIRRKYDWPKLPKDVRDYVATCTLCQQIKPARHSPHGELQSLPLPERPWMDITMDFITDLPPSKKNSKAYDCILVIVDRYTKMSRYIPTRKTIDAEGLADVFFAKIFRHYGAPRSIVSDRGPIFTAKYWSTFCYLLTIRRRLSTAFHPQTDGQTERQNQTLEQYLRAYTNYQQDDWVRLLPYAEFAYNNSRNATTGLTPFFALYGYNPDISICEGRPKDDIPAASERLAELQRVRKEMESAWSKAVATQATYYNRHRTPKSFAVGDMVYLVGKNIRTRRPSKKLDYKKFGPYKVLETIGKQAYRLDLPNTLRVHDVFHVSLLEMARARSGQVTTTPTPVEVDNHEEWEVDEVLDSRIHRGNLQYLVRWSGCSDSENQWLPADDVANCAQLLREFHAAYPRKPGPSLQRPTPQARRGKKAGPKRSRNPAASPTPQAQQGERD